MMKQEKPLYTLIPLEDFKALMGVDDREDKAARFCLLTSTFSIEQFCKRQFLRKTHTDYHNFAWDNFFTLREYPVRKIISIRKEQLEMINEETVDPVLYRVIPDGGVDSDLPSSIEFSDAVWRLRGSRAVRVSYIAGYGIGKVPPDLASACLELAIWNMNRYRGRRIGMTGNIRGSGRDGEHFELSMPENVRGLLEPYKRRVI